MSDHQSARPCISPYPQVTKCDESNCPDLDRGWVFHRNRGQPAPDTDEPAIIQIKFYLDRYRIKEAMQVFFQEDTLALLGNEPDFMWEIVPLICKRLRGLCQYRFRVFEGCERMLNRIAIDANCNPKEVLISLLAEINNEDDNVFRASIRPLENTLLRMKYPSPRDENLRWVLNLLTRHIQSIGAPQECEIDVKTRPCSVSSPEVARYIEVLPLMLNFIDTFTEVGTDDQSLPILSTSEIDSVMNGELGDDDLTVAQNQSTEASITALMNLMYRPLTFLDITCENSAIKFLANRYLVKLLRLRPNLFSPIYKRLIETSDGRPDRDLSNHNNSEALITLATCSYVYQCERMSIANQIVPHFPQVITQESLLTCHMPYVVGLLQRTEVLANEKGLILFESLIRHLNIDSLDSKFLEMFKKSSLLKYLFNVTVFSPLDANRRKAYDIFTRICDLFAYNCKYDFFIYLMRRADLRPSIRAACIDQYRRHLTTIYREVLYTSQRQAEGLPPSDLEFSKKMNSLNRKYQFLGGRNLTEFLDLCINVCIPESQHTDIIENYELLLATLSILRFLKLRKQIFEDEAEVQYLTGQRLKKSFFEIIRGAIALIGKDLKETQKTSKSEEADCLSWALCRLDLIESVLLRTCDLYDC